MPIPTNDRSGPPPFPAGSGRAPRREIVDGKYALLRELGSGAAATVYEAEHVVVGKRVAVKLLHRLLADDEGLRERFVGEARAAAQINHENVVDIYDMGVTPDGTPYLVMELLHGETLEQLVGRRGALPPAYACELMVQVLSALSAAHGLGIVHRDLKPANVMVTHPRPDSPLVKVLDFGIAKGVLGGSSQDEGIIGTPLYMAPEQALGQNVDGRADVYAAGVILYQLLAGEPPFDGTVSGILQKVIAGKWKPLASINPAVPRLLVLAVANAMAKDPNARLASVQDFARQLAPYLSHPPPHSVPMGPRSADAFLLIQTPDSSPDSGDDPFASRPPRDFPSLHLAKVDGKPRGEPLADAILQSPVIPRAPVAPKIHWSGARDLEHWSDAPAPPSSRAPETPAEEPQNESFSSAVAPSGVTSRRPMPWRKAAWAAAVGIGLGALFAWLRHFV